jgi:hypothetical protein
VKKIFSKVNPDNLLHVIFDANEPFENRADLSDATQWLQVSAINIPKGKKVNPHIHNPREQVASSAPGVTQECWVILRGEIKASLFDLDHALLHEQKLPQGNLLVTFSGGHSLECENGALMIECKNGPYLGRDYTLF